MARPISKVAPDWWDYTTLAPDLLADAAMLTAKDIAGLARDGFEVTIYDTTEEFYCAEALEYVRDSQQATPDNPVGVCGLSVRLSNYHWLPE
jgi:glucosamine-6-phosphate deaminase